MLESLSRVHESPRLPSATSRGAVSQSEISGEDLEKHLSALADNRRICLTTGYFIFRVVPSFLLQSNLDILSRVLQYVADGEGSAVCNLLFTGVD